MEVLRKNKILVECNVCKSIIKVEPDDIYTSKFLNGCIVCPVCKKRLVIYNVRGELNDDLRIKILKDE